MGRNTLPARSLPKSCRKAPPSWPKRRAGWTCILPGMCQISPRRCNRRVRQTLTYGDIARQLAAQQGGRVSAQAVGGAVGHNPISLIIPCHRVVGTNGSLTGYAGGIEKKVQLLELEHADMRGLFIPQKGSAL